MSVVRMLSYANLSCECYVERVQTLSSLNSDPLTYMLDTFKSRVSGCLDWNCFFSFIFISLCPVCGKYVCTYVIVLSCVAKVYLLCSPVGLDQCGLWPNTGLVPVWLVVCHTRPTN